MFIRPCIQTLGSTFGLVFILVLAFSTIVSVHAADPYEALLKDLRAGALRDQSNATLVSPITQDATLALFTASGYWSAGEVVSVTDMPFTKAYNVQARQKPDKPWLVQLQAHYPTAVNKGTVLYISFWVRAKDMASATIEVMAIPGSRQQITVGPTWTQCAYTAKVKADNPADTPKTFTAFIGQERQSIELGGFLIVDLGGNAVTKNIPTILP